MATQMTTNERLSALFDGELSEFECRRLTAEVLTNAERKATLLRYQIMRDVMRGDLGGQMDSGFADRVMQSLANEEIQVTPAEKGGKSRAWLKPVVGLAMAASVAAVSIAALQLLTRNGTEMPVEMAETVQTPASADVRQVAVQSPAPVVAELPDAPVADNALVQQVNAADSKPPGEIRNIPLTDPRMDSYLATHAEHASRPGMLSRVRIVGYSSPADSADKEER